MATSSLAAFWFVSLLLVLVPGPDWAYAVASGLRRASAIPAVGGLLLGYAVLTLTVMAGVAALVAGSSVALSALTTAGSAYLVWLGIATVRRPATVEASTSPSSPPGTGTSEATARSGRSDLLAGVWVSGLNPKGLLLFLALLPQFTVRNAALSVPLQIGILGFTHIVNCAVVYLAVALLARAVLRTKPAIARGVARVSGVAMIAIGVILFAERLHS